MRKLLGLLFFCLCFSAIAKPDTEPFSLKVSYAQAGGSPTVSLTFDYGDTTTAFNIYRLATTCPASPPTSAPGGFIVLNSAPFLAHSYEDSTVSSGTYCYFATATNSNGESVPSNLASAVVEAAPPPPPPPPTVTGVTATCAPKTVGLGATAQCTAVVSGTNNPPQTVNWTATHGTINSSGVFTSTSAGTATVTATSALNSTKHGKVSITVKALAMSCTYAAASNTTTCKITGTTSGNLSVTGTNNGTSVSSSVTVN